MQIGRKILVLLPISYAQQEVDCWRRAQTKLFSKIQLPITAKLQLLNVPHNFCSVLCYIVLIWILIILTLANNILSHPFNCHKPVCCITSDKIKPLSSDIHIRIRQILEVEIHIRRMRIFNNFVTSLIRYHLAAVVVTSWLNVHFCVCWL